MEQREIEVICQNIFKSVGMELPVPVVINGRLTRALGRVKFEWIDRTEQTVSPIRIEFSKIFLERESLENIQDVAKHECAHAIASMRTKVQHGHDDYFKSVCAELGCENNKAVANISMEKAPGLYKYDLFCSKCGKYLGYRSRSCAVTQKPNDFLSNCCKRSLKVVQNW